MNKQKFSILALASVLIFASCKKNDAEAPVPPAAETTVSGFKTVSSWQTSTEDKYTSYSGSIQDNAITADVVENGLVLVYMKNAGSTTALPFQAKGANDIYFNYQVSENLIQVNADAYSGSIDKNAAFSYFILTPGKLKSLEAKGNTRLGLMTLTYENAATLLK